MKRTFLILSVLLSCKAILAAPAGVTYEFSGGRFGDNLLSYMHAKWISHKYQIPLLYKPFDYSSELLLDDREIRYDLDAHGLAPKFTLRGDLTKIHPRMPFLYVVPYFPEIQWELKREHYHNFFVDWTNREFRAALTEMIAPKKPLNLIVPPKNLTSIAIHLREGGGYDDEEHKLKHPLKTPPISYYVESLKKVFSLLGDSPVYCYVFTDASDPKFWIDQIKNGLPQEMNISFEYRETDNRHDLNVLEDFFSLFNFDILIRSESNYSIIPALMKNYMIVCAPATFSVHGKVVTIDEIKTEYDPELLFNFYYKKATIE